jgi:broad specificity phosphatase PhoE
MARDHWEGDDVERPLSAKGRRQADLLAGVLIDLKPGRILSSPALRCRDTVEPLGRRLGLPVEDEPRLAEGSGRAALGLLRAVLGENVVLCSHGDVIPEILAVVAAEDGVRLGSHPRVEKGSVWVLHDSAGRFTRAEYLAPPA